MANLHSPLNSRFGMEYAPTSFSIRMGKREIFVCRDFRKRYYYINPFIDCSTGIEPGHLEVLFLRRWLIILSRAVLA